MCVGNSYTLFALFRSNFGLQGSGATDFFCSKCFLERQKNRGCQEVSRQEVKTSPVAPAPVAPIEAVAAAVAALPEPMEVEIPPTEVVKQTEAVESTPKKKTKKTSYKAMMAAMTKASGERDVEKEKEKLRKVTGGGTFSKIDKI